MVTILGIIFGFFLLTAIVVFVAPFVAILKIQYSDSAKMFAGSFSWLHPLILRGKINIEQQKLEIVLFHWFHFTQDIGFSDDDEELPDVQMPLPSQKTDVKPEQNHTVNIKDSPRAYTQENRFDNDAQRTIRNQPSKNNCTPPKNSNIYRLHDAWIWLKNLLEHPVSFFVRQKIWRQAIFRWFMLLIRIPRQLWPFVSLHLNITAHIQDPATTGKVYGYWIALSYALSLQTSRRIAVEFVPVFDREILDVHGEIYIRTSLQKLFVPLLLAGLKFPFLTTWRVWRAAKKHNKKRDAESKTPDVTAAAGPNTVPLSVSTL